MNPTSRSFQVQIENDQIDVNPIKKEAFKILTEKCNKCHQKKKRLNIFTLENMDVFAPQIKHQIFVSKRMPKGRTKLTASELKTLSDWLTGY